MRILSGVMVENSDGNEIPANATIGEGTVELVFDEPVQLETYLTVRCSRNESSRRFCSV